MSNQQSERDVVLVLRPIDREGNVDPVIGLRRLLKTLLRSFGWRCVEVRKPQPGEGGTDDAN